MLLNKWALLVVEDHVADQISPVELSLNAALPCILIGSDIPDCNVVPGSLSRSDLSHTMMCVHVLDDPC